MRNDLEKLFQTFYAIFSIQKQQNVFLYLFISSNHELLFLHFIFPRNQCFFLIKFTFHFHFLKCYRSYIYPTFFEKKVFSLLTHPLKYRFELKVAWLWQNNTKMSFENIWMKNMRLFTASHGGEQFSNWDKIKFGHFHALFIQNSLRITRAIGKDSIIMFSYFNICILDNLLKHDFWLEWK